MSNFIKVVMPSGHIIDRVFRNPVKAQRFAERVGGTIVPTKPDCVTFVTRGTGLTPDVPKKIISVGQPINIGQPPGVFLPECLKSMNKGSKNAWYTFPVVGNWMKKVASK